MPLAAAVAVIALAVSLVVIKDLPNAPAARTVRSRDRLRRTAVLRDALYPAAADSDLAADGSSV